MGYGIRASLEAQRIQPPPSTGWWSIARDIDVDDYHNHLLFAILAGEPTVFDIEPIAAPRGLPDDVTTDVKTVYEEWRSVAWDVSWVSYAELLTAMARIHTIAGSIRDSGMDERMFLAQNIGVSVQAIISYLTSYQDNGYDTRMLFWFVPL